MNFWPQTFMDYINITSAIGTLFAVTLSLFLLIRRTQVLKITKVDLYDKGFHNNGKLEKNEYNLRVFLHNFLDHSIDFSQIFLSLDSPGEFKGTISQDLWLNSQPAKISPLFDNYFTIEIPASFLAKEFINPKTINVELMSPTYGLFKFKTSKQFIKDWNSLITNRNC